MICFGATQQMNIQTDFLVSRKCSPTAVQGTDASGWAVAAATIVRRVGMATLHFAPAPGRDVDGTRCPAPKWAVFPRVWYGMPDDDRIAITVSTLAGYGKPKRHTVSLPRITALADDKRYATAPADPRQMRGPSPKTLMV